MPIKLRHVFTYAKWADLDRLRVIAQHIELEGNELTTLPDSMEQVTHPHNPHLILT